MPRRLDHSSTFLGKFLMGIPLSAGFLLVVAWVLELAFGWAPCVLCWYQRYIMMAILVVGVAVWGLWSYGQKAFSEKYVSAMVSGLLLLCCLLWALGVGLSAYHTGVEWGWWVHGCSFSSSITTNTTLLLEYFQQENHVVSCLSEKRLLGFPLAFWNIWVCMMLLLGTLLAFYYHRKRS